MRKTKKSGFVERIKRLARYRLHIPMMRNRQPTHIVARGVMVGMIWAMTPFFGLHMALVLATWLLARRFFNWDFSLVNGLAWTWTTNVFTVLPAFYVYYLTGQLLFGNLSDPMGYEGFTSIFHVAEQSAADDPSTFGAMLTNLWDAFGLPLFVGSAIWSVISGWVAYHLSLSFVTRYREHRAQKMAAAKKRPGAAKKRAATAS